MKQHAYQSFWLRLVGLLLIFLFAGLQQGCGGSKSSGDRPVPRPRTPQELQQRFFIHGDINALIADSTGQTQSFLDRDSLEAFDNFSVAGFVSFEERIERSEVDPINSQDDLEDANSTDKEASDEETPEDRFRFVSEGNGRFRYQSTQFPDFYLAFRDQNGRLELESLHIGQDRELLASKVLHYSLMENGEAFSFLFEYEDQTVGRSIAAIYFYKTGLGNGRIVPTKDNYAYLLGRDTAIGWEKALDLEICGSRAINQAERIRRAVCKWDFEQPSRSIGFLPYTIEENPNPPPFSDLNHNCLYMTSNYRFEDQENTRTLGLALPVINYSSAHIVGGFIFIAEDAHEDAVGSSIDATITHEVGHMLGLGHEFARDYLGNSVYDSIMGYEGIGFVTPRDRAAIRDLYPAYDRSELGNAFLDLSRSVNLRFNSSKGTETIDLQSIVAWGDSSAFSPLRSYLNIKESYVSLRNLSDSTWCDLDLSLSYITRTTGIDYPSEFSQFLTEAIIVDGKVRNDCVRPQGEILIAFKNIYSAVDANEISSTEIRIRATELKTDESVVPLIASSESSLTKDSVNDRTQSLKLSGKLRFDPSSLTVEPVLALEDTVNVALFDAKGRFFRLLEVSPQSEFPEELSLSDEVAVNAEWEVPESWPVSSATLSPKVRH